MNECTVYLLVGPCGNYVASHLEEDLQTLWDDQIGETLAGSRVIVMNVNVPTEPPTVVALTVANRPTVTVS